MKTENTDELSDANRLPIWPVPVALGGGLLSFVMGFCVFVLACFSYASVSSTEGLFGLCGGLMVIAGLVSLVSGTRHIVKRDRAWIGAAGILLGAPMIGVGVMVALGHLFKP